MSAIPLRGQDLGRDVCHHLPGAGRRGWLVTNGIANWRWQGVPFYLRSGKSLAGKSTEVTLQFSRTPHLLFSENAELTPNGLSLCIQPDEGMHLRFETKIPGAGMRSAPVDMAFHYSSRFGEHVLPEAYERLLLDAIQGDASLFARSDEIELAWGLIDPLTAGGLPESYPPGNWGPQEADALLARAGHRWLPGCSHDRQETPTVEDGT